MRLSAKRARAIEAYFRRLDAVAAVYLIGSYARGDARRDSDIDLILETRPAPPLDLAKCKQELRALLDSRIDLHEHHTLPRYVRRSILEGSVLLYAREP